MALTKVTLDMIDMAAIADAIFPVGSMIEWPIDTLPAGRWLWVDGGESNRTGETAALFAVLGTVHGSGDGTTTFNRPDSRGRVIACPDNMGGTAAGRLSNSSLGAGLGVQSVTLTAAQSGLPAHTHTATSSHTLATAAAGGHVHTSVEVTSTVGDGVAVDAATGLVSAPVDTSAEPDHVHTITGGVTTVVNSVASAGASGGHTNVQPTLICNRIIKY